MPPRKEPKEVVKYPASKRKAPPFKPLRPFKTVRTTTTESENSQPAQPAPKPAPKKGPGRPPATKAAKPKESITVQDSDDGGFSDDLESFTRDIEADRDDENDDSSEDLEDNPLTMKSKAGLNRTSESISSKAFVPPKNKGKAPARSISPMSIPDDSPDADGTTSRGAADFGPDSGIPAVPQALILRILHEAFEDKATQIDEHAIQVLQKYIEIFVRETIERARLTKQEAVERGEISEMDGNWLELEDLEKVVLAMLLDF